MTLVGSLDEPSLSMGVLATLDLGRFSAAVEAGPSLRLHKLAGHNQNRDQEVSELDLNPSVDGAVTASVVLGQGVALGLRLGGGALLRRQRFLVGDVVAAELPRADFHAGAFLRLPLVRR
jgi:hypothetical protein